MEPGHTSLALDVISTEGAFLRAVDLTSRGVISQKAWHEKELGMGRVTRHKPEGVVFSEAF